MTQVRLEPAAPRSRVKHSTTEPLRSLNWTVIVTFTDHLLCLIALPFGAIFWIVNGDSGIYWPFTLFNFPFFWCIFWMRTVIVAFTDHSLCLTSLPLADIFWMRTVIVVFTDHLLCYISLPLGAIFWNRTVRVAFTDHLLCLISLPLGAIFWSRTVIVAFTDHLLCLISLPLGALFWMRTVKVAFTDHLLCLVSLPLGAIFWIVNCDSGIYWPFTLLKFTTFWCQLLDCFVWFDSLRPLNNLSVMRDGLPGLNQY